MTKRVGYLLLACVSLVAADAARAEDAPKPLPVADVKRDAPVSFEKEILPILSANCLACHNRTKAKGDLVLETPTDILKGGESGASVVPKKPEDSLLLKVSAHRQDPVMPPKGNKVAAADLTAEQLGLLKLWIEQGAGGTIGGGGAGGAGGPTTPSLQWQPVPAGLNAIYAVAVTGDGQYAACSRGDRVHVYHLPSAQLVATLADARLGGARPAAHRDLVQSLAFSPDGGLLASGAYREIKLWRRPRDARRFAITSAAPGGVNAVDVSPDGALLAAGGADGVVRLWSAKDGRPVREIAGHGGPVVAVRFSADGSKLAAASARTLRISSVADGSPVAQAAAPADVATLAWLDAGRRVAAAGGDAVVRVWDVPASADAALPDPREHAGHGGPVQALAAVGAEGAQLLSGSADGTVRVWDVRTGQVIRQVSHGAAVAAVAARPDGKRFASAGADKVVKLWDAEGKLVAEIKGDRAAAGAAARGERDVAFAAAEVAHCKAAAQAAEKRHAEQVERVKKAALADVDADKALAEKQKTLAEKQNVVAEKQKAVAEKQKAAAPESKPADAKAAEAEAKAAEAEAKKAESEAAKTTTAKAAAADELRLAIKSAQQAADGAAEALAALQAVEQEHAQAAARLPALKAAAEAAAHATRGLAFSADNRALAAAGEDGVVRTYSAETGAALESRAGHPGGVAALCFGSDATLYSGGADGAAVAWESAPQWSLDKQLGTGDAASPLADRVTALDFGPDGKLLAAGGGVPSREGEATLWDVSGGSLVRRFDRLHSDVVLGLDLSADGSLLATGAADRFVRVSETATGQLLKSFEGHGGHVLGVALHRGGRTIVSGSADNTVKVWDRVGGEQRKAIAGFEKEVTAVRFVGDAEQFVATAGDGKVRLLGADGKETRSFPGAAGFVYAAAVTEDGSLVIAGGEDGVLRAWNVANGQAAAAFAPPAGAVGEAAR